MGFEDPNKKGRKRAVAEAEAAKPPAKRPATAAAQGRLSPEQAERVRSNVRALYDSYNALINKAGGALDNGAFQALLRAAQGDITSQRLASRLVPRFIALFPDQVEVAAGALIKLHERYQNLDGCEKALEDHTRRDALQGLQTVLLAAASGTPHGSQAVKLILAVLFRLLPQAEAEAPSTEEQEEEEGEVAPADSQAAAAAGPWVRKVLRQALQHHPVTTLTFCFGCLGSSARNSSSSSSSGVSPSVVQGVRLWLREHILREPTPSREGTPIDCDGSTSAAAAAAAGGCAASLAAAAAAGAAGIVNGSQAFKGAAASAAAAVAAAVGVGGGAAAAGQQQHGSVLQSVLQSSGELRSWVRKEAKGLSRAPEEARAVLQAAMQLMPPERPPAASKRPYPGSQGQQQQQQQRPYGSGSQSPAGGSRSQQQQPQYQQPSPQQQQQPVQQHKAPNGVGPRPVNGMERSWSTPSPGRGPRGRAAAGRSPDPAAAGSSEWGQFPRPAGPICRLEPCVLLSNVPWHLKPHDLQQQLQAAEAWVLDSQPPGGAGSSSGAGARACCVLKTPLDAARIYMRHHKSNRLGPQSPPLQVAFPSSLPACSRSAAAAAAAAGAGGASAHLWVLRSVAGDAEKVTDDLREAGLIPKSVSRVNHPSEPGTVLEAHSAKEAADMLGFLLKTHAAAIAAAAAAAQQQQQHEELPPLPSDPPPGEWTPVGGSSSTSGKPPSTPAGGPGPGASRLQQQQSAGGGPPPSMQQQQGGQAGFAPGGVRRSNSLPVGVAGGAAAGGGGPGSSHKQGPDGAGGWRQGSWGTPGGGQQQQQWQQGASPGQPGDGLGGRGGWQQSGTPMQQQQQQQQQSGRWPPGGQPGSSGGGSSSQGFPPFPGPPGAGPPPSQQQQQQQQQQRQHNYAGASPSAGPAAGGTPTHAGSPAGGGPGPSLPVGSVPPGGQYNQQQYAGAHVMWRGTLYKSEVPVGTVCCVEAAGGARQMGSAPEPHAWPQALHINHRISVNDALEHYAAAAPHARAVRVLLPQESPAGNVQAIQSFVQYLTSKGRAGMVKLPAANGASPRAVYLIVPRPNVCQSLQVAWDGRCVMLIVVVVPQGAGGASGGGGGGGSSGGGAAKGALPGPPPGGGGGGGGGYHHHPGSGMGHRPVR